MRRIPPNLSAHIGLPALEPTNTRKKPSEMLKSNECTVPPFGIERAPFEAVSHLINQNRFCASPSSRPKRVQLCPLTPVIVCVGESPFCLDSRNIILGRRPVCSLIQDNVSRSGGHIEDCFRSKPPLFLLLARKDISQHVLIGPIKEERLAVRFYHSRNSRLASVIPATRT